MTSWP